MSEAEQKIQRAADDLIEHYDAVLILVSKGDGSETFNVACGRGNVFTRIGMAKEYVIRQEEISRHQGRKDAEG